MYMTESVDVIHRGNFQVLKWWSSSVGKTSIIRI